MQGGGCAVLCCGTVINRYMIAWQGQYGANNTSKGPVVVRDMLSWPIHGPWRLSAWGLWRRASTRTNTMNGCSGKSPRQPTYLVWSDISGHWIFFTGCENWSICSRTPSSPVNRWSPDVRKIKTSIGSRQDQRRCRWTKEGDRKWKGNSSPFFSLSLFVILCNWSIKVLAYFFNQDHPKKIKGLKFLTSLMGENEFLL